MIDLDYKSVIKDLLIISAFYSIAIIYYITIGIMPNLSLDSIFFFPLLITIISLFPFLLAILYLFFFDHYIKEYLEPQDNLKEKFLDYNITYVLVMFDIIILIHVISLFFAYSFQNIIKILSNAFLMFLTILVFKRKIGAISFKNHFFMFIPGFILFTIYLVIYVFTYLYQHNFIKFIMYSLFFMLFIIILPIMFDYHKLDNIDNCNGNIFTIKDKFMFMSVFIFTYMVIVSTESTNILRASGLYYYNALFTISMPIEPRIIIDCKDKIKKLNYETYSLKGILLYASNDEYIIELKCNKQYKIRIPSMNVKNLFKLE